MATGIVVGLTRYRDSWSPADQGSNASGTSAISNSYFAPTMNHHRSYSDAPDHPGRLRLPPISNLIEGAGGAPFLHRSSYSGSSGHSQLGLTQGPGRPPPLAESPIWAPSSGDVRASYIQEQPRRFDRRPTSETFHVPNPMRRTSVTLPHISGSEVVRNHAHVLPQQILDPLYPHMGKTAKNVVREELIPGKGVCYVYEDGTVCEKVINGDTVNPKWGTTKAGKPRKRLGQACNTCREKKIKCDPSYPKCTQCQKFGRECRFEAPSRTMDRSPKMRPSGSPTAANEVEEAMRARRPSEALTEASSHSEAGTISSRAACTVEDNLSPLTNDSNFLPDTPGPSKRARLTHVDCESLPVLKAHGVLADAHHSFALELDPLKVNRKLAESYLSAYFNQIDNSELSLVPRELFLRWVESADDKSQASKLVLYCMLALGCRFSKNPDRIDHGRIFGSIALEGIMQSFGHFSIQLIQARIMYALYEFQQGKEERAWDLCGAAMRTAFAMKLNTEDGIAQQVRENGMIYGLDQARLSECMRRTFWMAYTMDNLGAACLCITTTFSKADCFLRLPCTTQAYEDGSLPETPLFDGDVQSSKIDKAEEVANVGTLGYLAQIASLCCDIRTLGFRVNHRVSHNSQKRYLYTRDELDGQLRTWNESYTAHVNRRFSQKSPKKGQYPFAFGGLHFLYHYACMQLHRNMPHSQLSRSQVSEHVRMAFHHAESTLTMAEQFTSRQSLEICDYHLGMSSPISGYAIHFAIDIITAAGINARLLEHSSTTFGLILNSVRLLDSLAAVWSSARIQQKQVSDRVRLVLNVAKAGIDEGKIGFCMEDPMVALLGKEEDLVYGIDRMQYLKSFDWAESVHNTSDLSVVSSRGTRGTYSVWKD